MANLAQKLGVAACLAATLSLARCANPVNEVKFEHGNYAETDKNRTIWIKIPKGIESWAKDVYITDGEKRVSLYDELSKYNEKGVIWGRGADDLGLDSNKSYSLYVEGKDGKVKELKEREHKEEKPNIIDKIVGTFTPSPNMSKWP